MKAKILTSLLLLKAWSAVPLVLALLASGWGQEIFAQELPPNPFKARVESKTPVTYHNPVIPGFYSDPSVVRVGEDYYLVTSTFEYFPGIPVFHSRDLVNWEQIGHVIHRPGQLPQGLNIFACTIRYHEGTFYVISTNTGRGGNFIATATNPAGPWSEPIWLGVGGIDPDLFFDDDGKAYTIGSSFDLVQINPKTGALLSEGRKVWASTGGRYAEGPHLYKKDGWYYLMAAEGGTEEAHSETIARSHAIWGPYYSNPANPILTHVNAAGQQNPIQGVGHADLVQAVDGSWWLLFHGYRTVAPGTVHHTLGRETCLGPVDWPKNGWPQVNGNGTITVDMRVPTLPTYPVSQPPKRTNFDQQPGLEWNYIQAPAPECYSVNVRPGFLRLRGAASVLGEGSGVPSFIGRRVQHFYFSATSQVDFEPAADSDEAGMVLLNNGAHFDLLLKRSEGRRVLAARLHFGSVTFESKAFVLASGPVTLRIEGLRTRFRFSFAQGSSDFTEIQSVDAKYLSSETVGGFTGTYVGLYATGRGRTSASPADFDWFEYAPQPPSSLGGW